MKAKLILLSLLMGISCFAQFSKTHYIPPISNSQSVDPQEQVLYISCPSTAPINFRIIQLGSTTITGTVSRDTPYVYNIGSGIGTQLMVTGGEVSTIRNDKGFIIEAEDLVYVTVRTVATQPRNHAGGIVSKGLAALGTQFRVGAFINRDMGSITDNHYTFAAILATENNTVVSFSDIDPGVTLVNNAGGNTPASVTLNAGQSYVIATQGPSNNNRNGLIGALISSTKPIAVNCGSYAGSNGTTPNLDLGFDQIVSAERTGQDYIFIKGNGVDAVERPLIVADQNGTEIYTNGGATPVATINAGDFYALSGADFSAQGNLYVHTSKKAFAYQGIGGSSSQANQNMHFVPPLTCETPKIINNIPFIDQVGSDNSFTGNVCIVTEAGASLNFIINGNAYTMATLPTQGVTINGPFAVTGNAGYETYTFEGMSGNISVFSTKSVYLSYFGSSGAATYGGFYSGFTFEPEIAFNKISVTSSNCIPNVRLEVNNLSSFDVFQWYFNENPIPGATSNSYTPTVPGYYHVKATISACGTSLESDRIPVSDCPTDRDNDNANDNYDIDNDNDGITNCAESLGDVNINVSNPAAGTVAAGSYSNTFTGAVTNTLPAAAQPFIGNADGSFITEMPAGKGYAVDYTLTFAQPVNIELAYPTTAAASDLINANAEYIVKSDVNKTITVLNPTNQLLIDTNYDGIYESGVTKFSSFEIRFRINGNTPIPAGTGTFKFQSFQTTTFKITHKNLLDSAPNKSTFKLIATCVPMDTDGDGIPDQLDTDSDGDGIPDVTEAQVNAAVAISNADTNDNGLDNAFEPGFTPIDTDGDGVKDYFDLDSDNDGILDANELIADTDADGIKNYRELDSDNDLCYDVIEAGFLDPNNDGILGATTPPTTNTNGLVTSGTGYTAPNGNYIIAAPIVITTQPQATPTCELQSTTISVSDNGGNTYQWELSTDGGTTWGPLTNNAVYNNVTTATLTITSVTNAMNGHKFRVQLNKTGNSCGLLSAQTTLTIYPRPVVNNITLIQCDDDLDLRTTFNLTINNAGISANAANETFTYYTTLAGANTANAAQLISNPQAFPNTASPMQVWARVVNANGCFNVAQLTLVVSASQIPQTYSYVVPPVCDDELAADGSVSGNPATNKRDGITAFDLSNAMTNVQAQLPPPLSNYDIKYYRNQADALAQNDVNGNSLAIPPSQYTNFRNDIPNNQDIWVRVNSILGTCSGFGPFIKLTVEKLPVANPVGNYKQCDDNQDGSLTFNTSTLQSTLLGGQSLANVTVAYWDQNNNPLPSPFPATFTTSSQTIKARVTNNTPQACYDETTITFIVDDLPEAFPVPTSLTTVCDNEADPNLQDGEYPFDTSTFQNTILNGQTGVTIKYFDGTGVQLSTPLPNPFMSATQNISVVVENTSSPSCTATVTIPLVVNPVPNIYLTGDELVCTNLPTFNVTIDAGLFDGSPTTNYTYSWALGSNTLPQTTYSIAVNQPGTYTVQVTSIATGCSRTRTITVVASNVAVIQPATVIDLTDENTITVNVTGDGNYVYSLNEPNGPFQQSNTFYNVMAGNYTAYVKDLNGCGITSKVINVLGAPKFFTPNGDGYHDTWNVKGISQSYNSKTIIYIFDRYGKLLKQLAPLGEGWNGTFNGQPMPADDYWYSVEFEDGRTIKGNFALKR